MIARLRHDARGATAVEFALVFPVLLLLVLGILEFSRAMYTQSALEYAAEEGARYAIAHTSAGPTEIADQARATLNGVDLTTVQIEVVATTAMVTVTLTQRYQFLAGNMLVPGGPLTLTAVSRFPRS